MVSCTPNSTVGHLSIFTSRLTFSFSFFRGFGHFPFLFPRIYFFSEHSPSSNNVASGSNQNISSIYFTGNKDNVFGYSLLDRSRIILDESGYGNDVCGYVLPE